MPVYLAFSPRQFQTPGLPEPLTHRLTFSLQMAERGRLTCQLAGVGYGRRERLVEIERWKGSGRLMLGRSYDGKT